MSRRDKMLSRKPNVNQFISCVVLTEAEFPNKVLSSSCLAMLFNSVQISVHTHIRDMKAYSQAT
jgi:hypothetical protein